MSRTKTNQTVEATCVIKRPCGFSAAIKLKASLNDIGKHGRAAGDAVDAFLFLSKSVPKNDKEVRVGHLDMIKFRTSCKHKGDEEEHYFIGYLTGLLETEFNVKQIGFPLDKDGNVISDDKLYIEFIRK